ncbi:putative capsule polysaccharide export protein [Pedobacter sp. BAL39]|uniref:SLBB domain-containing protein n=1 Tax=Pedobacter sp. BAL39 TaxID=391596 RepID=UPI00015597FD|nr:SLBB domain-containing protein [Pedobacter sp. BAL39]EDM37193.1 putative capsule polysaccharide export protein [Pedobacter sp. BAL39]
MNLKRIITAIVFLIAIFTATGVYSQTNYSNVKVDELSDAQIRQMMTRAESVGYTDAQLEQMASAQGMRSDEVQKLRMRVSKIREQGAAISTDVKAESNGREFVETTQGGAIDNEKKEKDEEVGPKIFGSELFRNGSITFEPNLRIATPKGYIIGPDDKLLIDLTGDNEASYNLQVSTEGYINLQYVGRIAVGGLTIDQATSKIRTAMSKTYPSLRSGRTSLAINLGNIRSIKVTITGQAVKTGTYTLPSLATVYNALYASGGPSANGSFRNIQVIRNNKVVSTIDVYNFLLKGVQQDNIRLQDQDVINIPVFSKRVEITGEVKQAALFEIVDGESLQNVINFAGGFTTQAYTAKIKSFQNTDRQRKITDVNAADFNTYSPKNGDKYVVEAILDRFENRVEIIGAVFRPGLYQLDKGLSLVQLINKADGLTEDAFMNRGYISRLNIDNTSSLLSFDVAKVMSGAESDIVLQREDKVTISSLFDLRDEYKVSIQGEVRAPGTFDYADNLNLEALIQMAGGFKEGATPNRIEISRRVKNSDAASKSAVTAQLFTINVDQNLRLQGDTSFILSPFDIVTVRNSTGYEVQKQVKVEGEVLYPGVYTITKKEERISDLIARAGGLTPAAYQEGASLKRPGPTDATKTNDKNAIHNEEEDALKLINLRRSQQTGAKDTLGEAVTEKIISSDLVGINLDKILRKPGSRYDLFLEQGDVVRVPKQLQTVKVTGEVLSPNSIVYSSGKSFKQYVNGAGGFTFNAYKKGAHIKYANGSVEAARKFLFFNNYPKVKPGAEILVPKRAEKEKLSVQGWVGIGTAIASMAAIVVSLLR